MQVGPRCQGMYDSYAAPLIPSAFSRPKVTKQLYAWKTTMLQLSPIFNEAKNAPTFS